MTTETLDPEIIETLHAYIQDGGKTTPTLIAQITGSKENAKEYVDAVKEKYSEIYFPNEVDETPPNLIQTFQLLNDKGILQPLVVVKSTDSKVILKFDEPTDKVTVFLKGGSHEIDLYQLRKVGAVSPFEGVSVATLLMLGELAKA